MDWQNLIRRLAPLRTRWDVALLANMAGSDAPVRPVDLINAINAQSDDGQLKDALPPGGYLVIGDLVAGPDLDAALDSYNATGAAPYRARSAEQFTRLFGGLDLDGGAVGPACRWRPEPSPFTVSEVPAWGAAGRKR